MAGGRVADVPTVTTTDDRDASNATSRLRPGRLGALRGRGGASRLRGRGGDEFRAAGREQRRSDVAGEVYHVTHADAHAARLVRPHRARNAYLHCEPPYLMGTEWPPPKRTGAIGRWN
jgi:hypothetical protein